MECCSRCGEPLPEGAPWCSLCFRKPVDRAELAQDLRVSVSRASWAPEDRFFPPGVDKRYARARGGPLSFGLWPKIAMSLAGVLAGGFVIMMSSWNDLYRGIAAIFVAVSGALFLSAIWRKERIE